MATLTAIFSAQDRISNKLAGIASNGRRATTVMSTIERAVERAFKTSPLETFSRNSESSFLSAERSSRSSSNIISGNFKSAFDQIDDSVNDLSNRLDRFTDSELGHVGDKMQYLGDRTDNASNSLGSLENKTISVGGALKSLAAVVTTGLVASKIQQFATDSMDAFTGFESGMKEVATLLPDASGKELAGMNEKVKQFALDNAKLSGEVIPALYNSLSAGVPQNTVFDFIEDSNKLAVGGVAELNDSVAVLSTIVNNYKSMGLGASEASDLLFTTVKKGVTTIPELSSTLGEVVPSASASGVAFSDVTAAMSTLTASLGNGSTATATTKLRGMLDELSTTGSEVDQIFRRLSGDTIDDFIQQGGSAEQAFKKMEQNGIKLDAEFSKAYKNVTGKSKDLTKYLRDGGDYSKAFTILKQGKDFQKLTDQFKGMTGSSFNEFIAGGGNLQQALEKLDEHAKDSNLSIKELFSSVEAGGAALILGNTGANTFIENMEEMKNSAGAADKAYQTMIDSEIYKKDKINSLWENTKLEVGEELAKAISPGTDYLIDNFDLIKEPLTDFFYGVGDTIADIIPKIPKLLNALSEGFKNIWSSGKAVFEWAEDNPVLLKTMLTGIGSAIITYKVVSGLAGVAGGIKTIGAVLAANPWAVLAAGAAAGIMAIGTAVSENNKRLKVENLEEHFGTISLSMKDIEQVASDIVQTDNLSKLREALDAFSELDGIQSSIKESLGDINKMNWKVSIGVDLTEDESVRYQSAIDSYISDMQSFVEEKQYAVNIAVGVLADDDLEGRNIVNQINQFYGDKQSELSELGTKLNNTVTDAFKDGLLDMDEVAEITELQQQMARIQSALAGSNFDANLDLLGTKFSGGELDAQSFQNLQSEIQKQVEAATVDYESAYVLSVSNAQIMLKDGAINKAQFDTQVKEFKENYLEQVGDIELKAANFSINTIMEQYDSEIGNLVPKMKGNLETALGETIDFIDWSGNAANGWTYDQVAQWLDIDGLDKTTKAALSDLFSVMEPQLSGLEKIKQQYKECGIEIPNSLSDGITNVASIGVLTGSERALWSALGETVANSGEHTEILRDMHEKGIAIPDTLINSMLSSQPKINATAENMYAATKTGFINSFGKGIDVTAPVNIAFTPSYSGVGNIPLPSSYIGEKLLGQMPGHALGGIFDKPHIALFAEKGPESAIPLDGSPNAISLWEETGKILGKLTDSGIGTHIPSEKPLSISPPVQSLQDTSYTEIKNRTVTVKIEGAGGINVGAGANKEEVVNIMIHNIRPVLMNILQQEIFEEGDLSYDF